MAEFEQRFLKDDSIRKMHNNGCSKAVQVLAISKVLDSGTRNHETLFQPIHGKVFRYVLVTSTPYDEMHPEEHRSIEASVGRYAEEADWQQVFSSVVSEVRGLIGIPDGFRLRAMELMCTPPGAPGQEVHRDCEGFNVNAMVYLTSGHFSTWVGGMCTTVRAGDVGFFAANEWHAGPSNPSSSARFTLFLSFGPCSTDGAPIIMGAQ
jgi:quercetin dioxygenase-like cupin family protein